MLQIVGDAGRDGVVLAFEGKLGMDGAEICGKIGQSLGKTGPVDYCDLQPIGEGLPADGFVQPGVTDKVHWLSPFRK